MINAIITVPVEWLMAQTDAHTYVAPMVGLWVLRGLWLLWTNNNGEE